MRDDNGVAADVNMLDGVPGTLDRYVEGGRAVDLHALADHDRLAESDPAVPGEVDAQRPGRRIIATPRSSRPHPMERRTGRSENK